MNKRKIDIVAYVGTILWSIFAACVFSGALIYYAQYDVINNSSSAYNDKILNEYIKNTVISQNEDLEAERPNDYRIDIYLGYLHKVIKEYDKAEQYYKKAVAKAPRGIYKPIYELASFYIEQDRLKDAEAILEDLPEKSNSSLIKYQSYLSRKLGDSYYNKGLYYFALEHYENASYFWHKQHDYGDKYTKDVNNKIYQSAVNMADICVHNNKIDEAIFFLRKAEKVNPKNFNVLYKLALATANSQPEESYKYFRILFKEDPTKVDYVAYFKLLENLSAKYFDEGDYTKAKLYAFRAKDLLDNVAKNLIYPKDIDFKIVNTSLYTVNRKYKILIKFNLQNISSIPIKQLKMDVVYKLNDKTFEELSTTLVEREEPLMVGESIKERTIVPKTFKSYKKDEMQKIKAEIYLYKIPNRKICVFNDYLFEQKRVEIQQPKHCLDCHSYIKFFAKQILNFKSSVKDFLH